MQSHPWQTEDDPGQVLLMADKISPERINSKAIFVGAPSKHHNSSGGFGEG